jgi:hypothetical protein
VHKPKSTAALGQDKHYNTEGVMGTQRKEKCCQQSPGKCPESKNCYEFIRHQKYHPLMAHQHSVNAVENRPWWVPPGVGIQGGAHSLVGWGSTQILPHRFESAIKGKPKCLQSYLSGELILCARQGKLWLGLTFELRQEGCSAVD